ncbi:hypothetical protein V8C44DRAFT_258774 [Trichoderma aethiopicum]
MQIRSAQHHTPHPHDRAARLTLTAPLPTSSATAFPIHRSLKLANPPSCMALLLLLFPPQGLPKPSRKNNKGCLTPYSNENAGAAATSSLRAATSTRPVWPSCPRFFSVLGLFLVCTQADTGDSCKMGKERREEEKAWKCSARQSRSVQDAT